MRHVQQDHYSQACLQKADFGFRLIFRSRRASEAVKSMTLTDPEAAHEGILVALDESYHHLRDDNVEHAFAGLLREAVTLRPELVCYVTFRPQIDDSEEHESEEIALEKYSQWKYIYSVVVHTSTGQSKEPIESLAEVVDMLGEWLEINSVKSG